MNTSPGFGKRAIMLTLAIAAGGLITTTASAQSVPDRAQIRAQEQQLASYAKAHNATLSPIDLAVHETLAAGAGSSSAHPDPQNALGTASHDCTATATLTAAKRHSVKFAATAPTCSRAIGMVAKGVKAYL